MADILKKGATGHYGASTAYGSLCVNYTGTDYPDRYVFTTKLVATATVGSGQARNTTGTLSYTSSNYWKVNGTQYSGTSGSVSATVTTYGKEASATKDASATQTTTVYKTHSAQAVPFIARYYANRVRVSGSSGAGGGNSPGQITYAEFSETVSITAKTSYAVSYNANGGSGTISNGTKWYGENLTLSNGSAFSRTGYTLTGWNTKADKSGTHYNLSATYTGNAALTLYAEWTLNTYAVSYNSNGGSGTIANQTKSYGVNLTLSNGSGFSRTNYTLTGWNTQADGTGTHYDLGGTYTSNAALALYAEWELNVVTVKIKINNTWYTGIIYVKINGDWKLPYVGYVKINGEWKNISKLT